LQKPGESDRIPRKWVVVRHVVVPVGASKVAILLPACNFIQLEGLGFTCTIEKLIKLKLLGARRVP
jgi:hypothetical protein